MQAAIRAKLAAGYSLQVSSIGDLYLVKLRKPAKNGKPAAGNDGAVMLLKAPNLEHSALNMGQTVELANYVTSKLEEDL